MALDNTDTTPLIYSPVWLLWSSCGGSWGNIQLPAAQLAIDLSAAGKPTPTLSSCPNEEQPPQRQSDKKAMTEKHESRQNYCASSTPNNKSNTHTQTETDIHENIRWDADIKVYIVNNSFTGKEICHTVTVVLSLMTQLHPKPLFMEIYPHKLQYIL